MSAELFAPFVDWPVAVMFTLLHTVWIGGIIGLLAMLGNALLPNAAAQARYAWNCGALTLLGLVLPIVFAISLIAEADTNARREQVSEREEAKALPFSSVRSTPSNTAARTDLAGQDGPGEPDFGPPPADHREPSLEGLDSNAVANEQAELPLLIPEVESVAEPSAALRIRFATVVCAIYGIGVLLMMLKLTFGLIAGLRLRLDGRQIFDTDLLDLAKQQADRLGLRVCPAIRYSQRVIVPSAVGVLKPTVLLPGSIVSGLSPAELADVLAHELAHLRRFDHLVVIVQRVLESMLFFHPTTWYLSRRIHMEREASCDELALSGGRDRLQYASALLRVAELRQEQETDQMVGTSLALDGGSPSRLRARIERLLGVQDHRRVLISGTDTLCGASLIAIAIVLGLSFFSLGDRTSRAEEPTAPIEGPSAPTDSATVGFTVVTEPGTWMFADGMSLEIAEVQSANEPRRIEGRLNWPGQEQRPALQHPFHIACDTPEETEPWCAAWEEEGSIVWVMSMTPGERKPYLRRIDFSNPDELHVHSELGVGAEDEEVTASDPESPLEQVRRRHFSIGSPMPRISDRLETLFRENVDGYRGRSNGPYSPLSGNYIAFPMPVKQWEVSGQVVDVDERPIAGVTIEVYAERNPTVIIAECVTDDEGKYQVSFRTDLGTLSEFRGVMVRPSIGGMSEIDLGRSGEFELLLSEDDQGVEPQFSQNRLVLARPAKADFVMRDTATIEGVIRNPDVGAVEDAYVYVRVAGQRQGYSACHSSTNADGRFTLEGVPSNQPIQIGVALRPLEEDIIELEKLPPRATLDLQLDFEKRNVGWKLSVEKQDIRPGNFRKSADDTKNEGRSRLVDRNGNPIPDARIDLRPYTLDAQPAFASTTTDDNGYFDYPDKTPASGYFHLVASAPGFVEEKFIGNFRVHVKQDGVLVPDTLTLSREVTIRGVVVGEGGQPLAGVPLAFDFFNSQMASINHRRFESDEQGRFEVSGVRPGELFVRFERTSETGDVKPEAARFYVAHVHVDEDSRPVNDLTIDLSRSNCTLEGQLVDEDGKGVADATIRIAFAFSARRLDHSVEATTDANGRFKIDGLPPHAFEVSARKDDLGLGKRKVVQLHPDAASSVTLRPFTEGLPAPADRDSEPNWGPSTDSIQSAIVVQPDKDSYQVGEVIDVGVIVRNDGDEAVDFTDTWSFNRLHIVDSDGNHQSLDYMHFTGLPWTESYRLEPGHEVKLLGSFNVQFRGEGDTGGGNAMFRPSLRPDKNYRLKISFGDGFANEGRSKYPDDSSAQPVTGEAEFELEDR